VTQLPKTIAIIGAGFCGTAVAVHLFREQSVAAQVVLIDPKSAGRGVAYAQCEYPYLLNVPAGRMSAEPGNPAAFLEFVKARLPSATAEDFVPRSLYGDYLGTLLEGAERQAPEAARLVRVGASACTIEPRASELDYQVRLADGRAVRADAVVLANGNPPPRPLPGVEALPEGSYIADPWHADASLSGENVLIVGTGLTMADLVTAAVQRKTKVRVQAISRHGLLPASQAAFGHGSTGSAQQRLESASASARQLFRTVRDLACEANESGGDWRGVITLVRNIAPALWQDLSLRERQRFLRHARSFWETHRHRLPQRTLAELERLRQLGQLTIHAGRILDVSPSNGLVKVTWRARGESVPITLHVNQLVNCTGPDHDVRRSQDPLMRSLLAQGLATPDPLGLGLVTSRHGQLVGAGGRLTRGIYYIGPLLRPDSWETTAVQELREHAMRLAAHLTSRTQPGYALGLLPPLN